MSVSVASQWIGAVSLALFVVSVTLFFAVHRQHHLVNAANHAESVLSTLAPLRPYPHVRNRIWETLLVNLADALDNANVPFFLNSGTALGVIRNGYFISGDRDIDVGVFYEDPQQVNRIMKALNYSVRYIGSQPLDEKYGTHVRWEYTVLADEKNENPCSELSLLGAGQDIHVDVFFWHPIPNTTAMDRDRFYTGHAANTGSYYCGNVGGNTPVYFTYRKPFKLKHVRFLGRTMRVADETFLAEAYGPNWRTPRKYSYHEGVKGAFVSATVGKLTPPSDPDTPPA